MDLTTIIAVLVAGYAALLHFRKPAATAKPLSPPADPASPVPAVSAEFDLPSLVPPNIIEDATAEIGKVIDQLDAIGLDTVAALISAIIRKDYIAAFKAARALKTALMHPPTREATFGTFMSNVAEGKVVSR